MTEQDHFPLLTDAGRRMLRRLQEHAHAPRWNYLAGDRLTAEGLAHVREYARRLKTDRLGWRFDEPPAWLPSFVAFCRREVPFHRRRLDWSDDFRTLPAIDRDDLKREPWSFVPDSADLTGLQVYGTSGTTGTRLEFLSHAEMTGRYLPLIESALEANGVRLQGGERVSIVHVCAQLRTCVTPSVMSYLDFAGFAKINLNPDDWRDPDDRVRFLDDCDPEMYTGDPFSLSELARLSLRTQPRALVSAAMTLLPGLRRELAERFRCPVIDLYSLNESGPVAFDRPGGIGHEVLPHDLYVEVLDAGDQPCSPGVRGEIALTGGSNPFLPLLRYRTGDQAALDFSGTVPVLTGLEGRAPVVFRNTAGRLFNSIDVTAALRNLPLPFFALYQAADASVRLRTRCDDTARVAAEQALRELFGDGQRVTVEVVPDSVAWAGKPVQYTSDLVT